MWQSHSALGQRDTWQQFFFLFRRHIFRTSGATHVHFGFRMNRVFR